jgi:hypothetical protein
VAVKSLHSIKEGGMESQYRIAEVTENIRSYKPIHPPDALLESHKTRGKETCTPNWNVYCTPMYFVGLRNAPKLWRDGDVAFGISP